VFRHEQEVSGFLGMYIGSRGITRIAVIAAGGTGITTLTIAFLLDFLTHGESIRVPGK
jgi:hypothetical protein